MNQLLQTLRHSHMYSVRIQLLLTLWCTSYIDETYLINTWLGKNCVSETKASAHAFTHIQKRKICAQIQNETAWKPTNERVSCRLIFASWYTHERRICCSHSWLFRCIIIIMLCFVRVSFRNVIGLYRFEYGVHLLYIRCVYTFFLCTHAYILYTLNP